MRPDSNRRRLCPNVDAGVAVLIFVAVAACTFWIAGDLYGHGSPWARDVCGLSRTLCDHPLWGAFATAAAAILYLLMRGLRL